MKKILYKIFGTRNERLLKQYYKNVHKINELESTISHLSDEELKLKTHEFKTRFTQGESLNSLLAEAFAVCREASKRALNMRHFDVQLIGGMVLNDNKIAEMKTGEGKTLVATLPAYLNALTSKGVHIVTVNDYLASRDALEMSKLFNFLGLTVGVNKSALTSEEKKSAYECDITYGTNNEFGFDYLRDNMVYNKSQKVQRGLNFAIVDEVDSILIDEARTPLIISGPADEAEGLYLKLNSLATKLSKQESEESKTGDFWVDEKNHNIVLSERGHEKVEELLQEMGLLQGSDSLYNVKNIGLLHHVNAALKAHYVYHKDQHYVVQNQEVVIVDEFTGRLMPGRRWSDGLHQAVEAKEGVKIERENQTLATITFQNYFRMYEKLSGMTGTANTEAYEFHEIYNLETVVIPTNKPMVRIDHQDKIYMNVEDKYLAIIEDIKSRHQKGQPILVGTTSVENSEVISRILKQHGLKHEVLNAKNHSKEAEIITQAGKVGAITVATNMAGRGTDIILGGNSKAIISKVQSDAHLSSEEKQAKIEKALAFWQEEHDKVIALGGLCIIGTERHESRRIDNQLRGRAGRQGDPGSSQFYLSLEDPLLRIFGGEKMRGLMQRLGMKKGESITHKWLSNSIESAQRKVEGHNFDIRKQLLEYDNVANDQRHMIYEKRDEVLVNDNLTSVIENIILGVLEGVIDNFGEEQLSVQEIDHQALESTLNNEYFIRFNLKDLLQNQPNLTLGELKAKVKEFALELYKTKLNNAFSHLNSLESNNNHQLQSVEFERNILLQHIDHFWQEHLTQLEYLRQGIHLRGYAQKDPKQEYKQEAFVLFSGMLESIKQEVAKVLLGFEIQIPDSPIVNSSATQPLINDEVIINNEDSIHRNAQCPCGSGKKFKRCCGKL